MSISSLSDLNDLCRLCLAKCSMSLSIFNEDQKFKKIEDLTSIALSKDDRFPMTICHECDQKLDFYYQFKQECKKVQYYLFDLIKSLPRTYYPHHYQHNTLEDVSHHFYKEIAPESLVIDHGMAYDDVQNIYASSMEHQHPTEYNHYVPVPQYTPNDENVSEISGYKDEVNIDQFLEHHEQVAQPEPQLIDIIDPQEQQTIEAGPITPIESNNQIIENIAVEEENPSELEAEPEEEPFDYDDFDENFESGPQSVDQWNNVDDAIEEKIEEFRNKKKRPNPKICPICNKLFRTPYKLKSHMNTHTDTTRFNCNYEGCSKTFKSKIGLDDHEARHSGNFKFICMCGKGFASQSYLTSHQKTHTSQKTFQCNQCDQSYKSKQALVDHEYRHLGLTPFPCSKCSKSFVTKGLLDNHCKTKHETSVVKYSCLECSKSFTSKSYLRTHSRSHNTLKKISCFCGKTFLQNSDLELHTRTHTGIKNQLCHLCPKSFIRKETLLKHIRTHTKEKNFKCEFCEIAYSQLSPLLKHKRRVHAYQSDNIQK